MLAAVGIVRVRHLRVPARAALAVLVGAGLAFAACGGSRAGPTPDAEPSTDAGAMDATDTPPPRHTSELTITGSAGGQARTIALQLTVQGP
jgi:hypothetical protein